MKDVLSKTFALAAKHRSPMPPPSSVHKDKRRKPRSAERALLRREWR